MVWSVFNTNVNLSRVFPEGSIYAGDEVHYDLTVANPLSQDIGLQLIPAYARLTLLEAPQT